MPILRVSGKAWVFFGNRERGQGRGGWVDYSKSFAFVSGDEPSFIAETSQLCKASYMQHTVKKGTMMRRIGPNIAICEKHYQEMPDETGAFRKIEQLIKKRAMRECKIVLL